MVDDTSTVWAQHAGNLLAVERYIFFPSSRRQFGLPGKSLLELNRSFPLTLGRPKLRFRLQTWLSPVQAYQRECCCNRAVGMS